MGTMAPVWLLLLLVFFFEIHATIADVRRSSSGSALLKKPSLPHKILKTTKSLFSTKPSANVPKIGKAEDAKEALDYLESLIQSGQTEGESELVHAKVHRLCQYFHLKENDRRGWFAHTRKSPLSQTERDFVFLLLTTPSTDVQRYEKLRFAAILVALYRNAKETVSILLLKEAPDLMDIYGRHIVQKLEPDTILQHANWFYQYFSKNISSSQQKYHNLLLKYATEKNRIAMSQAAAKKLQPKVWSKLFRPCIATLLGKHSKAVAECGNNADSVNQVWDPWWQLQTTEHGSQFLKDFQLLMPKDKAFQSAPFLEVALMPEESNSGEGPTESQ